MKPILIVLGCLWMTSCDSSVLYTFPDSDFQLESCQYSEGWFCSLIPLSGSCTHYYEKLYYNGNYLDLYSLTGCQMDASQRDKERLVSILWMDSARVHNKPAFIASLHYYDIQNADSPYGECESYYRYYLISERNHQPRITFLGCNSFSTFKKKFALSAGKSGQLIILLNLETLEMDTLHRNLFLSQDHSFITLSPDEQTFACFEHQYSDSLGFGWKVTQIQRKTHRVKQMQVSHLDDSTSWFQRKGVDATLKWLFRWQKDATGMTVLEPLSDTLHIQPLDSEKQL